MSQDRSPLAVPTPPPVPGPEDPLGPRLPHASNLGLSPAEHTLWQWINAARAAEGLPPLQLHPGLQRAARCRCAEVVATGAVRHASRRWPSPYALQQACGVVLRVMGAENLACFRTLAWAHAALMASAPHRANLLHPQHGFVGLAVGNFPTAGVAVCQEFGGA
jgi:uncharacterized protein YkwD